MSLSIYIPRVFTNIQGAQIAKVFEDLNLGKIERIDMVPFIDEKKRPLFRAFVYIDWADNEASHNLQCKITNPQLQAKIVYDNPWFWYLLPNKTPMTAKEVELQRRVEFLEFQQAQLIETFQSNEQLSCILDKDNLLFGDFKRNEVEKLTLKNKSQSHKDHCKTMTPSDIPEYVNIKYNSADIDDQSAIEILRDFIMREDTTNQYNQLSTKTKPESYHMYWSLLNAAFNLCRTHYGTS
jgi:hypothetical protein